MKSNVLKLIVEALIHEALRGFNLDLFKRIIKKGKENEDKYIDDREDIKLGDYELPSINIPAFKYVLATGLPFLGDGSSRAAFAISNNKALKIAKNEKGIAQNKAEVEIWMNPKTKAVAAKIFNFDDEFYWTIMEIGKPLSEPEFYKYFNLPDDMSLQILVRSLIDLNFFYRYAQFLQEKLKLNLANRKKNEAEETQKLLKWYEDFILNPPSFFSALANLVQDNKLGYGDIYPEHFAKTVDGRIILYDYGFTKEVARRYYPQAYNYEYFPK